jgi:hypothetical protein
MLVSQIGNTGIAPHKTRLGFDDIITLLRQNMRDLLMISPWHRRGRTDQTTAPELGRRCEEVTRARS